MTLFVESHSGWTAKSDTEGGYDIIDANGAVIATLHYDYRHTSNVTNRSRSRLIAAAPEMLAALQLVMGEYDNLPLAVHVAVDDAIRKATQER